MGEVVNGIIAGIVVAILSGIGGFLIRQKFYPEHQILPRKPKKREIEGYSHLNGEWHLYFLTRDAYVGDEPIWIHGLQELQVIHNNQVVGSTKIIDHPSSELHYEVHGEIRYGRMIITDNCIQDETEFASVILPNLRSATLLQGIWTGFDNNVHLISAPVILSRSEMTEDELNEAITKTTISLVPMSNSYTLYSRG